VTDVHEVLCFDNDGLRSTAASEVPPPGVERGLDVELTRGGMELYRADWADIYISVTYKHTT